jgi:hypothetical protein
MKGFERRNPINPDEYPTVYQRYKDATKRFIAYMENQARAFGILSGNSKIFVQHLMIVADHMDNEGCTVDPLALTDLKLTIRIRTRVAKSVFGGGDSGHKHFLTVLNYCWTVLVRLPRMGKQHDNDAEPTSSRGSQANHFGAFENDIDDEEIDDVDADIFPSSVPRPEPEPEPMCLDDLINSDERLDAILFLLALDEIMGSVAEQYQAVRNNHRQNIAHRIPQSNMVEMLIEAVATNMGIQQVQLLDIELSLQYPHLTTPYRLLSTVVLPDITREVASIKREHAADKVAEKDVTVFLGDCLECSFRNVSDSCNRAEFIVPEFCKEYKADSHGSDRLQEVVKGLSMMTSLEVPLSKEEKAQNSQFLKKIPLSLKSR